MQIVELASRPVNVPLVPWRAETLNLRMTAKQDLGSRGDASTGSEAESLIAAIAKHEDRTAFAALFDHFAPRVKAYLKRMGADETVADDVVQEVMLSVWRNAGQFDPQKARVSTWVFTIARNRRIDMLRRERRPEYDPHDPALVPDPDPPVDHGLEQAQTQRLIRSAIKELPPEQAELLHMSYMEDKTHSLIAEELGLPLGTVKSRLRLAMQKMRSLLKDVA